MEQFTSVEQARPARKVAAVAKPVRSDPEPPDLDLSTVTLNNIELSISPEEIEVMLQREGEADFLPPELARRIQEAALASGLASIDSPVARKDLKAVCDLFEKRIDWLDQKISQIDHSERPDVVTRELEMRNLRQAAETYYSNNLGSTIGISGILGGIVTGITAGCMSGSFLRGLMVAAAIFGLTVYSWYRKQEEAFVKAQDSLEQAERVGEAKYQEPVNARLLEIYARHESTPFSSDREKRLALQGDLLEFQRSLEQTQNELRGLTTDLHALGLALKHSSPMSASLLNERQARQALSVLDAKAARSGIDAALITKSLGALERGEEFSATGSTLDNHLNVIAAMRNTGRFQNPELEAEYQKLIEETAARAEL